MTVEQFTATLTALVLALGGVPAIIKLLDWFRALKSGKARTEKERNRMALNQLEEEMSYRRVMQEYASKLRRMLIDFGVPEDKIPEWPVRKHRSYR
jgi:hypothetical protein